MTLGQNLQAARKAKGLSQEALAEQIGVSRQALGKWEKDTALPGLDNLQAAAQVLGVSVDMLLGTGDTSPTPAVTLDALRDLLAARDAEQRKHRRVWGLLGTAAAIAAVLLLVAQNLAYQRKMQTLTDSYAVLQSQLGSTTADLTTRMDELQDARANPPCWTGTGRRWTNYIKTCKAAGCLCWCRSHPARVPPG